ncbi:hypothetical protein TUBRATIS_29420 [Tubulinosema ratisbonensis]|uniref:Uncharacterized protein n=1 Tax=Tubulinosema ratisbonensis TaxID=291195 RepID=A0A437AHJ6_9MICR|nr:hypothetical protein TUBRATIS_29420 [Tubulinosema ratisbonensis]
MDLEESTNCISDNLSDELEDFTKSRSEVLDKMLLDSRIFKPITISENIDLYKTKIEELIKRKRSKLKIPDDYDFFEEIFNFASEGFNNDIKKMSTFLAALNFLSSGFEKYNLCGLESPENILTRKGTASVYSRNKLKEGIRLWNENFVPFQNIYEGYVCILAISEKFLFASDEFSEKFLYAYKYDILKSLKFIFE